MIANTSYGRGHVQSPQRPNGRPPQFGAQPRQQQQQPFYNQQAPWMWGQQQPAQQQQAPQPYMEQFQQQQQPSLAGMFGGMGQQQQQPFYNQQAPQMLNQQQQPYMEQFQPQQPSLQEMLGGGQQAQQQAFYDAIVQQQQFPQAAQRQRRANWQEINKMFPPIPQSQELKDLEAQAFKLRRPHPSMPQKRFTREQQRRYRMLKDEYDKKTEERDRKIYAEFGPQATIARMQY